MKYRNDLIDKKVLIICNSSGPNNWNHYCSYVVGKVISYNPSINSIMIEYGDKTRNYFSLIDYNDPFKKHNDSYNRGLYKRLAYKIPLNRYSESWWYDVFSLQSAEKLLNHNIKHSREKYVYGECILSKVCYNHISKKNFFELLLKELKDESN